MEKNRGFKKITEIKGLSEEFRLPRIDKIRLGAKIDNGSGAEYPIQLPFFLLPKSVAAVHGGRINNIVERAKFLGVKAKKVLDFISENGHRLAEELPVMIPVEAREISFPQSWKLYGLSAGLKCIGNGEEASERQGVTNNWIGKCCPCPHMRTDENPGGDCTRSGNLQVILHQVNMGAVYQIDIGSINSIIDINSAFRTVVAILGQIAMVPLTLRRVPTETHHGGKKQTHWTCQLLLLGNIEQIAAMKKSGDFVSHEEIRQIEAPLYSDPKLDAPDAVYIQPKRITEMIEKLNAMREAKKLSKPIADRIRIAVEGNDDEAIEAIYNETSKWIPAGRTANDLTKKMDKSNGEKAKTGQTVSQTAKDRF